jgi:hypothetical protein
MAFTNTSMYTIWFDHFIVGYHIWMGDDIHPYCVMRIELFLAIQDEFENDRASCVSIAAMLTVCVTGVFLIAGFVEDWEKR